MKKTWIALVVAALLAAGYGLTNGGCSMIAGYQQIDEMTEAEFESYKRRTVNWARLAIEALVEEEVVSADDLPQIAGVVRSISAESVGVGSVGVLSDALEADGWKQAALVAMMGELDYQLERSGFWDFFGERELQVLAAVAEAISPEEVPE